MSALIGIMIAIVFVIILFAVTYRPKYAQTIIPVSPKHADMHIAIDFTVRELTFFANIMLDIEKECQKPFFMRFWRYRANPDLNECHTIMFSKLVSKLKLAQELDALLLKEDTLSPDGE